MYLISKSFSLEVSSDTFETNEYVYILKKTENDAKDKLQAINV